MEKGISFERYQKWMKAKCDDLTDCDGCPFADDCAQLIELSEKIQKRFFKNGFYHSKG